MRMCSLECFHLAWHFLLGLLLSKGGKRFLTSLKQPLYTKSPGSPTAVCFANVTMHGEAYMVKDRRSGFACLICELAGDLDDIKSSPCNSQASGSPRPSLRSSHADDAAAMAAAQKAFQEEQDHCTAPELRELQRQEDELEQLVLLQNLEAEEAA